MTVGIAILVRSLALLGIHPSQEKLVSLVQMGYDRLDSEV
jgi:hypothetical protein